MQQPSVIDPSSRLQALTREYSRYSRSAGGLSAMAGGFACLASFLAGALLPTTLALRIVLIALPVLWIVGKQWLARRYYQRLGQVEEQVTPVERNFQRFFIAFTALVSVLVIGSVLPRMVPMGELRRICAPSAIWSWWHCCPGWCGAGCVRRWSSSWACSCCARPRWPSPGRRMASARAPPCSRWHPSR